MPKESATDPVVSSLVFVPYYRGIRLFTKHQPILVSAIRAVCANASVALAKTSGVGHVFNAARDDELDMALGNHPGGRANGICAAAASPFYSAARHIYRKAREQATLRASLEMSSLAGLTQERSTSSAASVAIPVL